MDLLTTAKPRDIYPFRFARSGVAKAHEEYFAYAPLWLRYRACLGGQEAVKLHDRLYPDIRILQLYRRGISTEDQRFYASRAYWPAIVSTYAQVLERALLRSAPLIQLPPALEPEREWLEQQIGENGESLADFLSKMISSELTSSRAWVRTSLAEGGEYPFAEVIPAERVIDWRTAMVDGRERLVQVRIVRTVSEFNFETFDEEFEDVIEVHELVEGRYQIRVYRGATSTTTAGLNSSSYQLSETLTNISGQSGPIDFLPIFPVNGSIDPVQPLLSHLCNIEIDTYNLSTRLENLFSAASMPTVVVKDSNLATQTSRDDQIALERGYGSFVYVNSEASVEFLAAPVDAISHFQAEIQSKYELLAKLGIRMLSSEGGTNQSGDALRIRNNFSQITLSYLSMLFSRATKRLITELMAWRGLSFDPNDIDVTLSSSMSRDLEIETLAFIRDLAEQGSISDEALDRLLKDANLILNSEDVRIRPTTTPREPEPTEPEREPEPEPVATAN